MAREIVLDTETTGLEPPQGHRLVENACLEIDSFVPPGRRFATYIHPCRHRPLVVALPHSAPSRKDEQCGHQNLAHPCADQEQVRPIEHDHPVEVALVRRMTDQAAGVSKGRNEQRDRQCTTASPAGGAGP